MSDDIYMTSGLRTTPAVLGDADEQLRADYKAQSIRHAARFNTLLDGMLTAQRWREAQVVEECNAARSAFEAASALRKKEALDLRQAFERMSDESARQRLRDRILQQCVQHDRQAYLGLQASVRFAESVLAGEIEIGRNVLVRVRSLAQSERPDGEGNSANPESAHSRLSGRVQEALALRPLHKWDRFGVTSQDSGSDDDHGTDSTETADEQDDMHLQELTRLAAPDSQGAEGPDPSQPHRHTTDAEHPASFDDQFSTAERDRELRWRSLLKEHDADIELWRKRFDSLMASLDVRFAIENAPGGSQNLVKAADEEDRKSGHKTSSYAEWRRARDLKQLWEHTEAVFALHHDAFVERLRAAELGLESEDYAPRALGPIEQRGPPVWMATGSTGMLSSINVANWSLHPPASSLRHRYKPPFAFANLLKIPAVARALPIASPRVRMRAAFRDAQVLRDLRFDAAMAAFDAEAQAAKRRHEAELAVELRSMRGRAAAAERERAGLFSKQIEAERQDWAVYRLQRARDEDRLLEGFENEFMHSQAAREEHFRSGVWKLHDHFMRVIREHVL